jgi:hypothetical protein
MTDIMVAPYLLSEMASYLAFGGAGYLAWRVVRAYERRRVDPARVRALAERVRRLEVALGEVEHSVRETAEGQRFTAQLLMTRAISRGGDARE